MSKDKFQQEYETKIENLRETAINSLGLSNEDVEKVFKSCEKIIKLRRQYAEKSRRTLQQKFCKTSLQLLKWSVFLMVFALVVYIILNVHQPTSSIVLRNVQGLIYPGLKVWRFLSVPFVKAFPSLTNLYDESCLLENPYFYVNGMECWPCENVHSVVDLSGFSNHSLYQSGVPYVVKTNQPEVTLEKLQELYENNTEILNKEAHFLHSNNHNFAHIQDILILNTENSKNSDFHISWRINRMRAARIVRAIFPRPYIVSEWSGQSMERYVMISGARAGALPLPDMDCSYVFVVQGAGQRVVVLKPAAECFGQCQTVSVLLKPSYVLWYNWWYWRPYSIPAENSTETSISYISSYC